MFATSISSYIKARSPQNASQHHLLSLHPIGTSAAATCPTPRSVASRLNCAAAFLVSCISSRMPRSLRYLRTLGAIGYTLGPVPMINKSGLVRFACSQNSISIACRQSSTYRASDTPIPGHPNSIAESPTVLSHSRASLPYRHFPLSPLPSPMATTETPRHPVTICRCRSVGLGCSAQSRRMCMRRWTSLARWYSGARQAQRNRFACLHSIWGRDRAFWGVASASGWGAWCVDIAAVKVVLWRIWGRLSNVVRILDIARSRACIGVCFVTLCVRGNVVLDVWIRYAK
jgi:hypothetical protein